MIDPVPVRLSGRDLKPHKATISPLLDARTVLTNSPWEFVSLWLRRQKQSEAQFYWNQAQQFARASIGLNIQSAPLLHYYSFMNAAKALLAAKGEKFLELHGVSGDKTSHQANRIDLANENVRIYENGVLPSLAKYLGDSDEVIRRAHLDHGYSLTEIGRAVGLHYATISRRANPPDAV